MLEREDRAQQAHRAGARAEVADGRLGRSERHRTAFDVREDARQRLDLAGVLGGHSWRVAFDESDGRRVDLSVLVGAAHRQCPAFGARRADRRGRAVARAADPRHERANPLAVVDRIPEALEREHRGALPQHGAVGTHVEGREPSASQVPPLRIGDQLERGQKLARAPDEREVDGSVS